MHYKGDNKNNTDTKAPDLSSLIRIGNIFVVKVLMLLPTISSTKVNMIAQYLPFNDTYNLGYASVSFQNKHIIQHLTTVIKISPYERGSVSKRLLIEMLRLVGR